MWRLGGIALIALGALLAVLPAFAWYATPPQAVASGFAGAGQLWVVPVLGALAVLGGVALCSGRVENRGAAARWAGPLAAIAGLLATGLTLWAGLDPAVTLSVVLPSGTELVPTPVELRPAAIMAPLASVLIAGIGGAVILGRRR